MIELQIESIRVNKIFQSRVVLLKDINSDRYLPIYIGNSEASAMAVKLEQFETKRPLTHDLICQIFDLMGWKVIRIVVSKIENDVFYAKIIITKDNKTLDIDARPSDALNIAIRSKAPIFANEKVMNICAITIDPESGIPIIGNGKENFSKEAPPSPLGNKELASLSSFEDFVESLDMKGIGNQKNEENDDLETTS